MTTLDAKIALYIEKISKRNPYAGKVVTDGIVTVKDSNWLLSYTLNRHPHFKAQPKEQIKDLADNSCNTIPVYMPYITSYFMPR